MNNVEEKMAAMQTINSILEGRGMKGGNTVSEHIIDALMARGWRGPKTVVWIKEMVFDQARMAEGNNPYKEGK